LPWHQSVTAFCQWTILRGSYDALRSSVCSKVDLRWILHDEVPHCQRLAGLTAAAAEADSFRSTMQDCKRLSVVALLAMAALSGACASRGNLKPQPFPLPAGSPAPAPTVVPPPPTEPRQTLIATALSFRGTPYRNGGSDPNGFDCSGFTQWVFARHGVALPREVEEQFKAGRKIKQDDLKPGDLVFFHTVSRGASHVGIFVAGDQFVHAPSSKGVVRVESINSSYWSQRFLGGRRLEGAAQAPPAPAVVRRRPFSGESAVASAAAARSGARGSRAAD